MRAKCFVPTALMLFVSLVPVVCAQTTPIEKPANLQSLEAVEDDFDEYSDIYLGGPGLQKLLMLDDERVQKEIGLSKEQLARLEAHFIVYFPESAKDPDTLNPAAALAEMAAFADKDGEVDGVLAGILQPEQFQRLEEVQLQIVGAKALTFPKVQEQLGLSADQCQTITAIFQEMDDAVDSIMKQIMAQAARMSVQEGPPQDRPSPIHSDSETSRSSAAPSQTDESLGPKVLEGMSNLLESGEKRVMVQLTPSQSEKLQQLRGKPYKTRPQSIIFSGSNSDRSDAKAERPVERTAEREPPAQR